MSNIAKALKAEISRISRKEAKSATDQLGKRQTELKKIVADLKKRIGLLEKENKRLLPKKKKDAPESLQAPPEETGKARFTSKGIRSLRSRLDLSQADFAKLMGATPHAVYLWEKKEGALRLREKTKAAFLAIRGLGAKEAQEKLAEAGTQRDGKKISAPKREKAR